MPRTGRLLVTVTAVIVWSVRTFSVDAQGTAGTLADTRDGKTYKTVKIGKQTWMAENLNYKTKSGSWCYDDNETGCKEYGMLYDWNAARKACPAGYRLPTKEDWDYLVRYAGGDAMAGKQLKAKMGWNDNNGKNGKDTDNYGFSALPGGRRHSGGYFYYAGYYGHWWTATEYSDGNAYLRDMFYGNDRAGEYISYKNCGFSVRCIGD